MVSRSWHLFPEIDVPGIASAAGASRGEHTSLEKREKRLSSCLKFDGGRAYQATARLARRCEARRRSCQAAASTLRRRNDSTARRRAADANCGQRSCAAFISEVALRRLILLGEIIRSGSSRRVQ